MWQQQHLCEIEVDCKAVGRNIIIELVFLQVVVLCTSQFSCILLLFSVVFGLCDEFYPRFYTRKPILGEVQRADDKPTFTAAFLPYFSSSTCYYCTPTGMDRFVLVSEVRERPRGRFGSVCCQAVDASLRCGCVAKLKEHLPIFPHHMYR